MFGSRSPCGLGLAVRRPPQDDPPALPLEQCYAKTVRGADGHVVLGATVIEHAQAAAACDEAIAASFPPGILPEGSETAVKLHDVGKIGPEMQLALREAAGMSGVRSLPELAAADIKAWQNACGGHAATGAQALLDAYDEAAGGAAVAIAMHHGRRLGPKKTIDGRFWEMRRAEFIRALLPDAPVWPEPPAGNGVRMRAFAGLCAGRIAAADWAASLAADMAGPDGDWRNFVSAAVERTCGGRPRLRPDMSFRDVFGFSPTPSQTAFFESASGPGVYVLEDATGAGKTEAALYAAYLSIVRGAARGIYVGLPTRLTSLKIFERLKKFLRAVCIDGADAELVHSAAWLDMDPECGSILSPKAALLHPFGAGTIDQALMAAVNVRYAGLRLYGLAGKTVILDEVHSYDAYTGSLVCRLAELLTECGCTVLILSATLASGRRSALLGRECDPAAPYPLVSALPRNAEHVRTAAPASGKEKTVRIVHAQEATALKEAVHRAGMGECVLWIENSVGEAQDSFRRLKSLAGSDIPCGLVHSRYTQADRTRNEDRWTQELAPRRVAPADGEPGRILVGTQVLEQSLDIDADFLVCSFCPSDMLMQRLGRLWRNAKTGRPAGCVQAEAWLLHPKPDAARRDPEHAFGVSGLVYHPYVLLRSLDVWMGMESFSAPSDVRRIMEETYAEREESEPVAVHVQMELERRKCAMRSLAGRALGTLWTERMDEEEHSPTRMMELPSWNVLLVRKLEPRRIVLADGTECGLPSPSAGRQARMHAARMLAQSSLAVSARTAPADRAPEWLEPFLPGHGTRCALLLDDGRVAGLNGIPLNPPVFYDQNAGWRTEACRNRWQVQK